MQSLILLLLARIRTQTCILGLFLIRMEDLRGEILRFQMTEFRQLFMPYSA